MSASKTATAAAKAVAKSKQQAQAARTPEQILDDIRKNFAAGLAVPPNDQKFLLAQYDEAMTHIFDMRRAQVMEEARINELTTTVTALQAKLDEFREVYEAENRSTSLTIERV